MEGQLVGSFEVFTFMCPFQNFKHSLRKGRPPQSAVESLGSKTLFQKKLLVYKVNAVELSPDNYNSIFRVIFGETHKIFLNSFIFLYFRCDFLGYRDFGGISFECCLYVLNSVDIAPFGISNILLLTNWVFLSKNLFRGVSECPCAHI